MNAVMLDDRLDAAFKHLIEQWNIAERRIKKAEQVRANEVVASAIFELRYAGRKIIDAFDLAFTHDWKHDDSIHNRMAAFFADATEDCVKAKHDAIDAMLDFIARWFDELEHKLGLREVQQFFPDYLEATGKITDIQDRIAESRGDRNRLRDAIYDQIEGYGYDAVLDLYNRMKQSEVRVAAEVRRQRNREIRIEVLHWGAGGIAIAALIAAVIALVYEVSR